MWNSVLSPALTPFFNSHTSQATVDHHSSNNTSANSAVDDLLPTHGLALSPVNTDMLHFELGTTGESTSRLSVLPPSAESSATTYAISNRSSVPPRPAVASQQQQPSRVASVLDDTTSSVSPSESRQRRLGSASLKRTAEAARNMPTTRQPTSASSHSTTLREIAPLASTGSHASSESNTRRRLYPVCAVASVSSTNNKNNNCGGGASGTVDDPASPSFDNLDCISPQLLSPYLNSSLPSHTNSSAAYYRHSDLFGSNSTADPSACSGGFSVTPAGALSTVNGRATPVHNISDANSRTLMHSSSKYPQRLCSNAVSRSRDGDGYHLYDITGRSSEATTPVPMSASQNILAITTTAGAVVLTDGAKNVMTSCVSTMNYGLKNFSSLSSAPLSTLDAPSLPLIEGKEGRRTSFPSQSHNDVGQKAKAKTTNKGRISCDASTPVVKKSNEMLHTLDPPPAQLLLTTGHDVAAVSHTVPLLPPPFTSTVCNHWSTAMRGSSLTSIGRSTATAPHTDTSALLTSANDGEDNGCSTPSQRKRLSNSSPQIISNTPSTEDASVTRPTNTASPTESPTKQKPQTRRHLRRHDLPQMRALSASSPVDKVTTANSTLRNGSRSAKMSLPAVNPAESHCYEMKVSDGLKLSALTSGNHSISSQKGSNITANKIGGTVMKRGMILSASRLNVRSFQPASPLKQQQKRCANNGRRRSRPSLSPLLADSSLHTASVSILPDSHMTGASADDVTRSTIVVDTATTNSSFLSTTARSTETRHSRRTLDTHTAPSITTTKSNDMSTIHTTRSTRRFVLRRVSPPQGGLAAAEAAAGAALKTAVHMEGEVEHADEQEKESGEDLRLRTVESTSASASLEEAMPSSSFQLQQQQPLVDASVSLAPHELKALSEKSVPGGLTRVIQAPYIPPLQLKRQNISTSTSARTSSPMRPSTARKLKCSGTRTSSTKRRLRSKALVQSPQQRQSAQLSSAPSLCLTSPQQSQLIITPHAHPCPSLPSASTMLSVSVPASSVAECIALTAVTSVHFSPATQLSTTRPRETSLLITSTSLLQHPAATPLIAAFINGKSLEDSITRFTVTANSSSTRTEAAKRGIALRASRPRYLPRFSQQMRSSHRQSIPMIFSSEEASRTADSQRKQQQQVALEAGQVASASGDAVESQAKLDTVQFTPRMNGVTAATQSQIPSPYPPAHLTNVSLPFAAVVIHTNGAPTAAAAASTAATESEAVSTISATFSSGTIMNSTPSFLLQTHSSGTRKERCTPRIVDAEEEEEAEKGKSVAATTALRNPEVELQASSTTEDERHIEEQSQPVNMENIQTATGVSPIEEVLCSPSSHSKLLKSSVRPPSSVENAPDVCEKPSQQQQGPSSLEEEEDSESPGNVSLLSIVAQGTHVFCQSSPSIGDRFFTANIPFSNAVLCPPCGAADLPKNDVVLFMAKVTEQDKSSFVSVEILKSQSGTVEVESPTSALASPSKADHNKTHVEPVKDYPCDCYDHDGSHTSMAARKVDEVAVSAASLADSHSTKDNHAQLPQPVLSSSPLRRRKSNDTIPDYRTAVPQESFLHKQERSVPESAEAISGTNPGVHAARTITARKLLSVVTPLAATSELNSETGEEENLHTSSTSSHYAIAAQSATSTLAPMDVVAVSANSLRHPPPHPPNPSTTAAATTMPAATDCYHQSALYLFFASGRLSGCGGGSLLPHDVTGTPNAATTVGTSSLHSSLAHSPLHSDIVPTAAVPTAERRCATAAKVTSSSELVTASLNDGKTTIHSSSSPITRLITIPFDCSSATPRDFSSTRDDGTAGFRRLSQTCRPPTFWSAPPTVLNTTKPPLSSNTSSTTSPTRGVELVVAVGTAAATAAVEDSTVGLQRNDAALGKLVPPTKPPASELPSLQPQPQHQQWPSNLLSLPRQKPKNSLLQSAALKSIGGSAQLTFSISSSVQPLAKRRWTSVVTAQNSSPLLSCRSSLFKSFGKAGESILRKTENESAPTLFAVRNEKVEGETAERAATPSPEAPLLPTMDHNKISQLWLEVRASMPKSVDLPRHARRGLLPFQQLPSPQALTSPCSATEADQNISNKTTDGTGPCWSSRKSPIWSSLRPHNAANNTALRCTPSPESLDPASSSSGPLVGNSMSHDCTQLSLPTIVALHNTDDDDRLFEDRHAYGAWTLLQSAPDMEDVLRAKTDALRRTGRSTSALKPPALRANAHFSEEVADGAVKPCLQPKSSFSRKRHGKRLHRTKHRRQGSNMLSGELREEDIDRASVKVPTTPASLRNYNGAAEQLRHGHTCATKKAEDGQAEDDSRRYMWHSPTLSLQSALLLSTGGGSESDDSVDVFTLHSRSADEGSNMNNSNRLLSSNFSGAQPEGIRDRIGQMAGSSIMCSAGARLRSTEPPLSAHFSLACVDNSNNNNSGKRNQDGGVAEYGAQTSHNLARFAVREDCMVDKDAASTQQPQQQGWRPPLHQRRPRVWPTILLSGTEDDNNDGTGATPDCIHNKEDEGRIATAAAGTVGGGRSPSPRVPRTPRKLRTSASEPEEGGISPVFSPLAQMKNRPTPLVLDTLHPSEATTPDTAPPTAVPSPAHANITVPTPPLQSALGSKDAVPQATKESPMPAHRFHTTRVPMGNEKRGAVEAVAPSVGRKTKSTGAPRVHSGLSESLITVKSGPNTPQKESAQARPIANISFVYHPLTLDELAIQNTTPLVSNNISRSAFTIRSGFNSTLASNTDSHFGDDATTASNGVARTSSEEQEHLAVMVTGTQQGMNGSRQVAETPRNDGDGLDPLDGYLTQTPSPATTTSAPGAVGGIAGWPHMAHKTPLLSERGGKDCVPATLGRFARLIAATDQGGNINDGTCKAYQPSSQGVTEAVATRDAVKQFPIPSKVFAAISSVISPCGHGSADDNDDECSRSGELEADNSSADISATNLQPWTPSFEARTESVVAVMRVPTVNDRASPSAVPSILISSRKWHGNSAQSTPNPAPFVCLHPITVDKHGLVHNNGSESRVATISTTLEASVSDSQATPTAAEKTEKGGRHRTIRRTRTPYTAPLIGRKSEEDIEETSPRALPHSPVSSQRHTPSPRPKQASLSALHLSPSSRSNLPLSSSSKAGSHRENTEDAAPAARVGDNLVSPDSPHPQPQPLPSPPSYRQRVSFFNGASRQDKLSLQPKLLDGKPISTTPASPRPTILRRSSLGDGTALMSPVTSPADGSTLALPHPPPLVVEVQPQLPAAPSFALMDSNDVGGNDPLTAKPQRSQWLRPLSQQPLLPQLAAQRTSPLPDTSDHSPEPLHSGGSEVYHQVHIPNGKDQTHSLQQNNNKTVQRVTSGDSNGHCHHHHHHRRGSGSNNTALLSVCGPESKLLPAAAILRAHTLHATPKAPVSLSETHLPATREPEEVEEEVGRAEEKGLARNQIPFGSRRVNTRGSAASVHSGSGAATRLRTYDWAGSIVGSVLTMESNSFLSSPVDSDV